MIGVISSFRPSDLLPLPEGEGWGEGGLSIFSPQIADKQKRPAEPGVLY